MNTHHYHCSNRSIRSSSIYLMNEMNQDFYNDFAEVLDKTIGNLSDISTKLALFADKCTINSSVPPHPGDIKRYFDQLKKINQITKSFIPTTMPQTNATLNNNFVFNPVSIQKKFIT